MGLYRALGTDDDRQEDGREMDQPPALLELWLDDCQNEYDSLVARVRHLDEILVKFKRKRSYLLPRRVK